MTGRLVFFITVITFIWTTNSVIAQKGTLDLGASIGVNFGSLEEAEGIKTQKGLIALFGGLMIEYELLDHFRVSYSLGSMTKGGTFIFDATDENGIIIGEISTKNKVQYLSNLISLKGRFGDKLIVFPEIGVSFDALIGHEFEIEPYGSFSGKSKSEKELYNTLNTSLVYGIGVRYMFNSKIGLGFSIKANKGLNSLSDEPSVSFMAKKPNNYLCGLEFILAIR